MTLPASCVLSLLTFGGLPLSQLGLLLYAGFLIWILFPLIFTPHGIFVGRYNLLYAMRRSMSLTRMMLPVTALMVFVILVISEGLDVLWRVPADNSWLMVIGIVGHAFITTSLLAATFVFYRDADHWAQSILQKMKTTPTNKLI
jgi:hypothetical protein